MMSKADPDTREPGAGPRYYGKYRGTVIENIDPEGRGRILAQVTKIYGEAPSCWALPCLPGFGFPAPGAPTPGLFTVPPLGSWVWIEFEEGDPERPIWSGGFWPFAVTNPTTEAPVTPTGTVLQSTVRHAVSIDDVIGITLQLATGAKVQLTPAGILVSPTPTVELAVTPSGITMMAAGSMMSIGAGGVIIMSQSGQINLTGQLITMNEGALVVK